MVGPRVSGELAQNGILGIITALGLIMVYVWFRFEWQYSLGAVIATLHDVVLTIGFLPSPRSNSICPQSPRS